MNSSDGLWALVVSGCLVPDSGMMGKAKIGLVCVGAGSEVVRECRLQMGWFAYERSTPGQVVLALGRAVSPWVCKAVDARAPRKQETQSSFNWPCDEGMPNRQIVNLRKHRTCVSHL